MVIAINFCFLVDPPQPTINIEPEEEKKKPLTPVTALSFSPTLYIPEYFGLVSCIPASLFLMTIERGQRVVD